jgi:hypothetical protein
MDLDANQLRDLARRDNTPEDAVQSFLWALQNQNLTNLLQLLTPESARKPMQEGGVNSPEKLSEVTAVLPGMRLVDPQQMPDGSIEARVEFLPGEPMPDKLRFEKIGGQWRMEFP